MMPAPNSTANSVTSGTSSSALAAGARKGATTTTGSMTASVLSTPACCTATECCNVSTQTIWELLNPLIRAASAAAALSTNIHPTTPQCPAPQPQHLSTSWAP